MRKGEELLWSCLIPVFIGPATEGSLCYTQAENHHMGRGRLCTQQTGTVNEKYYKTGSAATSLSSSLPPSILLSVYFYLQSNLNFIHLNCTRVDKTNRPAWKFFNLIQFDDSFWSHNFSRGNLKLAIYWPIDLFHGRCFDMSNHDKCRWSKLKQILLMVAQFH